MRAICTTQQAAMVQRSRVTRRPSCARPSQLICALVLVCAESALALPASPLCTGAANVLKDNWVGHSTVPAPGLYPHQWSWDTAFIAVGHSVVNASRARIELESLFNAQWTNGLLPHIVFNPSVVEGRYFPGPAYWRSSTKSNTFAPTAPETSGIINPPVHAIAVLNLLRRDASEETLAFVHRILPKLEKFLDYLTNERDPDGNGLVYVRHPWENGMDNSPVWDEVLDAMPVVVRCHNDSLPLGGLPSGCQIPPYERADLKPGVDPRDRPSNLTYDRFVSLLTCARNYSYDEALIAADGGCPFLVEDVFFNVLLAQASDAMAAIVSDLSDRGRSPPSATNISSANKWRSLSARTRSAIAEHLWSPKIKMYASRDQRTSQLLEVKTIGGLSPLMLDASEASAKHEPGIQSAPEYTFALRRDALLRALRSDSFKLPYLVPTFDALSSDFSPRLYWRGPTWFNTDWLLLRGLESAVDSLEDASRLRTAMHSLINSSLSPGSPEGEFGEYWDPWGGEAHGTRGFSWTAALFLDVFCAEQLVPLPSPHAPSIATSPSVLLPIVGILSAVLAWGSFTVPMKSQAVKEAKLDPVVFQLYMCVGIILSSLILLAFPGVEWQWTWWAAASAAIWVPGSLISVLAVRFLGIAVAQGIWSGAIALVSFMWGQLFSSMRDPALGTVGILLLVCGISVISVLSAPPSDAKSPPTKLPSEFTVSQESFASETVSEDNPSQRTAPLTPDAVAPPVNTSGIQLLPGNHQSSDSKPTGERTAQSWQRVVGISLAATVGLFQGTVMVPLRMAPEHPYRDGIHALDFAVCFGPAALVVMLLIFGTYAATKRELPSMQPHTCLLPGVLSGVLWSIGNAGATLATLPPFGLTVGYPSTQTCLLIGGLWGIFWFGEIRGRKRIAAFFAAACVVVAGAALLGVFGAGAPRAEPSPPWWKTGIVYQVYPRSFRDSNDDGIGDLRGITTKLPYLADIGVDIVWLSPIYPSPMADFGYDIADYMGIADEFGSMNDFEALLDEAHRLGLRIILDFVPNHTSEQHPWFIESRSSLDNPKRNWYVWADGETAPNNWQSVFGGSAWERDELSGQHYYHAFLKEQPDLNYRNPEVVTAMQEVLSFWLKRGVDGFRVDAVPFLFESADLSRDEPLNATWKDFGARNETQNVPPIHTLCETLMATVRSFGVDKFFLGEAYAPLRQIVAYYGTQERPQFSMPFNFFLVMNASEYVPSEMAEAVEAYSSAVPSWGWTNFVMSNHDNPRIATKVGRRNAALPNLLLLTLRGTPTIYYGQELGMQDVFIPLNETKDPWARSMGLKYGRDPERTPMQWSCEPHAGFCSNCAPWLPIAHDYCSAGLNVDAQSGNASSMLQVFKATIRIRRRSPALVHGEQHIFHTDDGTGLFAYRRSDVGSPTVVVAMNWGEAAIEADLTYGFSGTGYAVLSTAEGEYTTPRPVDMRAVSLAPGEGVLLFSA